MRSRSVTIRAVHERARGSRATASLVDRVRVFVEEDLWSRAPQESRVVEWLRSTVQLCIVIGEGFVRDHLVLRAQSLTYLTILSIVPLLALAVTLADAVGIGGGGQEVVANLLDQFAGVTPEARAFIEERVAAFNFGALGAVGGIVLLGTTVLAVGSVEGALNAIWGVTEARPWSQRVPNYAFILLFAPVFMAFALAIRPLIESQWFVQRVLELPGAESVYSTGVQYTPLLLFMIGFSVLYRFLPNTQVRFRSALLGGVVAAVLFAIAQWAYVEFSIGAARANAVLGVLAGVALFMVWVYLAWAIVLLGAEVAYAHQTLPLYRREVRGIAAGPAARESIGLAIALECARRFRDGATPWSSGDLSDALDVPLRTVRGIVDELLAAGLLSRVGGSEEEGDRVQIGRPLDRIPVTAVLDALRGERESGIAVPDVASVVAETFERIDAGTRDGADARTLRELVETLGPT